MEKPGDEIRGYKLLEQIGQGGFGVVYLAEQKEPVKRRVALKIIKLGMDTQQVVARFEAERQALALMDHPNIAKILEAGATQKGRPYFVMELVPGLKVTDYCDENNLSTTERLNLFVQFCRAVQHAHQKGIIHRDLKPSNILVTMQDGMPVAKIIDFGIAKATQQELTEQTVFTQFGHFIGTPAYMSPEQAKLSPGTSADVDTRSDIYSLGVLLYELLTGTTPFDTKQLVAAGLDEMRRTIREVEPVKPSTRLTQQHSTIRSSHSALRILHSAIDKDLDWIVMKCLEKDRARRYETANGLARDIERHLNQEPVMARPPSTIYRVHKFIRRNRVTAAAATAIATILVLGIAVSAWQAGVQSHLRREAEAAKRDATDKLWKSYLAEARAQRNSNQGGRRFEGLEAVRQAAAIAPSLELRNEAIALLTLTDIKVLGGKNRAKQKELVGADVTLEKYAAGDRTGNVYIRRAADEAELARLPITGSAVIRIWPFSPDGRMLAVLYRDQRLRVWDWAKQRIVIESAAIDGEGVDFSPDNQTLGTSDSTNIVLYKLPGGEKLKTIPLENLTSLRAPGWFSFDPSGGRLALCATEADTNVSILDTCSGQTLRTLQHADHVWAVAWHPDARHLATGCADRTIGIWDSISGERVRTWRAESCISLGFNHQGELLASSGWDGYTRLWEFSSGKQLSSVYSSGAVIGFGTGDRTVITRYWNGDGFYSFEVASRQGLRTFYETDLPEDGGFYAPHFSSDGRFLATLTLEGITLWDFHSGRTLSWEGGNLNCTNLSLIGFSAGNSNLLFTASRGLFRWPIGGLVTGASNLTQAPVLASTNCADISGRSGRLSADGKICAVGQAGRCQIFRTDTFEQQATTGHQPGLRWTALSPDGSLLAGGAFHLPNVKVWNTRTGEPVKDLLTDRGESDPATTVVFSPDGHHLVTAVREEFVFWDVGSWRPVRRIPRKVANDFPPIMAFSGDGRILAGTHSRSVVRLHDAATGRVLADLEVPYPRMVAGLAFNDDGSQLAICESGGNLRVWDLRVIREKLAAMGLDWDEPAYPVAQIDSFASAPGAVERRQ